MARRHVLRDRGVLVRNTRAHVARNPLALVEHLDRAIREARTDGLAQQVERYRVVMGINLDVIVRRDRAALPLGILVALARKSFQRRPVETGEEIVATQSRTASFNSTSEKKRRLRSLPSTKRETMPTAASTLALSRGRRTRAGSTTKP